MCCLAAHRSQKYCPPETLLTVLSQRDSTFRNLCTAWARISAGPATSQSCIHSCRTKRTFPSPRLSGTSCSLATGQDAPRRSARRKAYSDDDCGCTNCGRTRTICTYARRHKSNCRSTRSWSGFSSCRTDHSTASRLLPRLGLLRWQLASLGFRLLSHRVVPGMKYLNPPLARLQLANANVLPPNLVRPGGRRDAVDLKADEAAGVEAVVKIAQAMPSTQDRM